MSKTVSGAELTYILAGNNKKYDCSLIVMCFPECILVKNNQKKIMYLKLKD